MPPYAGSYGTAALTTATVHEAGNTSLASGVRGTRRPSNSETRKFIVPSEESIEIGKRSVPSAELNYPAKRLVIQQLA